VNRKIAKKFFWPILVLFGITVTNQAMGIFVWWLWALVTHLTLMSITFHIAHFVKEKPNLIVKYPSKKQRQKVCVDFPA
jgi:heme exporter protein D